ncbi:MAG: SDR family NAD(P)-dependent oxidoreductase, partial [Myxococcota bacterium]
MTSGTDMTGRTCMITGATSGIGRAAALDLARLGASLVLVGRNAERGERALNQVQRASRVGDVTLLLADLSSQSEIRRLAADFLATGRPLHVLLNNAGVIQLRREESGNGIETTFAVNHLAYFLLTRLLLERLKESAPARVVNVASDAHRGAGRLDFDDLESRRRYSPMRVYGKSKLANILFTRDLARRLEGTGVTVNCLHPGFVGSNFAKNNGLLAVAAMKLPRGFALDDEDARRLWEVSERMTGLAASPPGRSV